MNNGRNDAKNTWMDKGNSEEFQFRNHKENSLFEIELELGECTLSGAWGN